MRGKKKYFSLSLIHLLRRSPPSPRKRVILDDGFCDFAFGSAQNDRVGGILRRVKVLGIEKLIIERI